MPLLQMAAILTIAFWGESVWGGQAKWSILYGGVISVVNLLWLQWRLRRSERKESLAEIKRDAAESAQRITADLYLTVLERFVWVIDLFLLGMVKLGLEPMALVTGFVVGQVMLLVASGPLGGDFFERGMNKL